MAGTRSFDPLSHTLDKIAGLDSAVSSKLKTDAGISSVEDLCFLTIDDLKDLLKSASDVTILQLRKLESIIKFVLAGNSLDATSTAMTIQKSLVAASQVKNSSGPAAASSGGSNGSNIKTPLNCIEKFSGDPVEFEHLLRIFR